jgi:hypothetical protein
MILLFVLRSIAVVNFCLYAQDFPIGVFLRGNGSSKSVLLDPIHIVMTARNRRYLDLSSSVSEGGVVLGKGGSASSTASERAPLPPGKI